MTSGLATATAEPEQPLPRPARRLLRFADGWLLLGCLAVAAGSLAVPALLGFDPWVWLIWGRELLRGGLATDGTVAWKPLPVLVTAVLAPFGAAAPALWTVLARAFGLFGLVLVFRLAARFAGAGPGAGPAGRVAGLVAGAVAAAAFLITPDAEARWLRHLLQANIEPVTVALGLWAVLRHLDGHRGSALLLGCAAALTRPEAWPLLLLYAAWLGWRSPRRWWLVLPALAVVPLLWFGWDLLLSGNPLGGAAVARVLPGTATQRLLLALDAVAAAVILPVWLAAAVGVVWAAHRRRLGPVLLAGAALVWMAEVVVMSGVFGYAALGRFLAPVAAVACVLAGTAVGWTAALPWPGPARAGAVALLLAAAVPAALPRVAWLPAQQAAAGQRAAYDVDLDRALVTLGRDRLLACGLPFGLDTAWPAAEFRAALAWRLDVPLAGSAHMVVNGTGVWFAQRGSPGELNLAAQPPAAVRPVLRNERWVVYAQQCPALTAPR